MPDPEWRTHTGARTRLLFSLAKYEPMLDNKTIYWLQNNEEVLNKIIGLGECSTRTQVMKVVESVLVVEALKGAHGNSD